MRLLVNELSSARCAEIERRMLPGQSSRVGFLAPGDELTAIIARDERTCAERGITPEQIADRLETLVGRAGRRVSLALRHHTRKDEIDGLLHGTGRGVRLEGFKITGLQSRGRQECPFEDDAGSRCASFIYAGAEYNVEHLGSNHAIKFSGLLIHLARDHHFFEGSVRYRLEPADAIDVLALESNVNYAPTYASETCWQPVMATADAYEKVKQRSVIDVSIEDALAVFDVAPGIRIYWKGARCVLIAEREHSLKRAIVIDGVKWRAERIRRGTYVYARGVDTYVV
jgi:hypothetical protein